MMYFHRISIIILRQWGGWKKCNCRVRRWIIYNYEFQGFYTVDACSHNKSEKKTRNDSAVIQPILGSKFQDEPQLTFSTLNQIPSSRHLSMAHFNLSLNLRKFYLKFEKRSYSTKCRLQSKCLWIRTSVKCLKYEMENVPRFSEEAVSSVCVKELESSSDIIGEAFCFPVSRQEIIL